MKLLAVDTVTEACSAALLMDEEVQEKFTIQPRGHTGLILPMIDELLSEAGLVLSQLDAIAVDRGPGSFTGVRISTGVVQGLAFSVDLPVVPISSLAALALAGSLSTSSDMVLAMIDARMNEVYWGCYQTDHDEPRLVGEEQVGPVSRIPVQSGNTVCIGSGAREYAAELDGHSNYQFNDDASRDYPHAAEIARLARLIAAEQSVSAERLKPVYLRNQVVKTRS